jgi:hypothetical protein
VGGKGGGGSSGGGGKQQSGTASAEAAAAGADTTQGTRSSQPHGHQEAAAVSGAEADTPPVGILQRWWRLLTGAEDTQGANAAPATPQEVAQQPPVAATTSTTQSGPPPKAVGSATAATRKPGADASAWGRVDDAGQAGRHAQASSRSKQSQLLRAQSEGSEQLQRHMRSKRLESWEFSQQYMHQKAAGVLQPQPQEYHPPRQRLTTPEQGSPPAHQWGQQVQSQLPPPQRQPQWQPSQPQRLPPDADTGRDRTAARRERRRQKRAAKQARKVAQQLQVPPAQSVAELLRQKNIDVGAYLRLDEPQDKEVLSLPGSRGQRSHLHCHQLLLKGCQREYVLSVGKEDIGCVHCGLRQPCSEEHLVHVGFSLEHPPCCCAGVLGGIPQSYAAARTLRRRQPLAEVIMKPPCTPRTACMSSSRCFEC